MKLMIASDIHGSALYCGETLEAFRREKADRLLLLGDLLYHGPRNELPEVYAPKEVAAMLNGVADSLLCVRGNCDAEVDQMVLSFPILAEYCVLYAGGRMLLAAHGHHIGDDLPRLRAGDILLCGHTHVAGRIERDGVLFANPGSVSLPKENTPRGYIILDDDCLTWKTLDGGIYDEYPLNGGTRTAP